MSLFLAALLAVSAQADGAITSHPVATNQVAAAPESQTDDDDSGPPRTPEQKAAAAAYRDYIHSLVLSLRASTDARDRALAPQMWFMEDVMKEVSSHHDPVAADRLARGTILREAARKAPDDALVQWLWMVAASEDSGCSASDPCPRRAETLVRLQPDNGSAWLPIFDAAWKTGDIPAAESALAHMALATRYDEQFGAAVLAWMDVYRRYPVPKSASVPNTPEAEFDGQTMAFANAMGMAAATAMPAFQAPIDACSRDKHPDASSQRFRDCAQIGRTTLMHSTSLIDRQIGRALLRVSGQATSRDLVDARVAEWQFEQWQRMAAATPGNEQDKLKADAADWLETGDEIQVLQRQMQRAGIPLLPPPDWQPRARDGRRISPLGESPFVTKHP